MYSVTVTYGMGVLIRVRLQENLSSRLMIIKNIGAIYMGLDGIL